MKTLIFGLALLLADRASAHPGCSGEPFAQRFTEFARSGFKVRPLPPGEPYSYIEIERTGEQILLDSKYQKAVRLQLGAMVERNESETLYSRLGWGEWAKWHARNKVREFRHLASRRFVLQVAGSVLENGARFGPWIAPVFTGVYLGGEFLEHYGLPILTGLYFSGKAATMMALGSVPMCGLVMGGCLYIAKQTQDIGNVMLRKFPADTSLRARLGLWWQGKKLRREVRRALAHVRRSSDDADLTEMARRRSYRDLSGGAEVVWGGPLRPGFFRSSLAAPICDKLDAVRLRTFKYKGFGGVPAPAVPFEIPVIDDLSEEGSDAQRVLRAEEYVAFLDTIFSHAALAAGDLIRNREEIKPNLAAMAATETAGLRTPPEQNFARVPLRATFARVRGYLSLRRDLGRMRRALDLYGYAIFMRALGGAPRSEDDLRLDRHVAGTLGNFIREFTEELERVDRFDHRPRDRESELWSAPKRTFRSLKAWMRTGQFCAAELETVP